MAAWQDSIRGYVQAVWDSLDRAQIELCRQRRTGPDAEMLRFEHDFGKAADRLIDVFLDPLFPADDINPDDLVEPVQVWRTADARSCP
jgi:hypothetical protein